MKQADVQDILLRLIDNTDCRIHQVFDVKGAQNICVFLMAEWNDNQGHILHILLYDANNSARFIRFFFTEVDGVIPYFREITFNKNNQHLELPENVKLLIESRNGKLSIECMEAFGQSVKLSFSKKEDWQIYDPKLTV